jgi:dihydrodipicolinate synthase/N-acetylneuraminate lyase
MPPAMPSTPRPPLAGVIPPLITPLADRDRLDLPGLERLVEHVITGGVDAIFLLGTSGEFAALSARQRRDLIARVARQVAGRAPLVVGISDTSITESLALASHATVAGVAAVVVTVPYYLPPSQDELVAYVRAIATAQPLPILLYNIPALTRTRFELDTVLRLAEVDRVIGMKDSSGELANLEEIRRRLPRSDWSLLVGVEHLFAPAVRAGLQGCVPGGANLAPRLFADLYAALKTGDAPRISELEARVKSLGRIYRIAGEGAPGIVRGLKTAAELMGLCSARMTEPFAPATSAERDQIRTILNDLRLL